MRIYESEKSAAAAAKALSAATRQPGLMASSLVDYASLTWADIDLATFAQEIAEYGDDYGVGLMMLRACSEGFHRVALARGGQPKDQSTHPSECERTQRIPPDHAPGGRIRH